MNVATREYGLFINGELAEPSGGELRDLAEPATGEALARAAVASEADVDRAVEAARAALGGPWGKTPPTERSRLLHALADGIIANRKELAELETRNVGKAIAQVKAEIAQGVENFRFFASGIEPSPAARTRSAARSSTTRSASPSASPARSCPGTTRSCSPPGSSRRRSQRAARPCSSPIRPTPLSAIRLAEIATEAGLPPGVVNVVPGDGPTTGAYLVGHRGVDMIAFTGSTRTGAEVMRTAADPLKRVILELGGKSPNVVFADADLEDAIPSAAWSIYYAAGQSCEARSRILVEASATTTSSRASPRQPRSSKVGDPLDPETQMGSLISVDAPRQGARVRRDGPRGGRRARARRRGAGRNRSVLPADGARRRGQRGDGRAGGDLRSGRRDHPLRGRAGRRATRQRLPIRPHGHRLDGRPGPRPPARTADPGRHDRGQPPVQRVPGIPFGGYKESGFGRELGLETLDEYLETKSVLVSTGSRRFNPFGL